jgi:hypothetical protein
MFGLLCFSWGGWGLTSIVDDVEVPVMGRWSCFGGPTGRLRDVYEPTSQVLAVSGLPVGEACRSLQGQGWVVVGTGDWATALADPTDTWCARLAPLDPAYRLFADDVLAGPRNRWLPHIDRIVPLAGEGFAVVMERLWPVSPDVAQGFCDAFDVPDATGAEPVPTATDFIHAADPGLVDLRHRVEGLLDTGASSYPRLWGGSDVRAGNVPAAVDGELKLVDPVFLSGHRICEALLAGDPEPLADLTRAQLEAFLTLPCFHREHDRYVGVEELSAALARASLSR